MAERLFDTSIKKAPYGVLILDTKDGRTRKYYNRDGVFYDNEAEIEFLQKELTLLNKDL